MIISSSDRRIAGRVRAVIGPTNHAYDPQSDIYTGCEPTHYGRTNRKLDWRFWSRDAEQQPILFTPQRQEEEPGRWARVGGETWRTGFRIWARDEENRTLSAHSRYAALSQFGSANSSPPPPMSFFPMPTPVAWTISSFADGQHVFPTIIHTYSSPCWTRLLRSTTTTVSSDRYRH